MTKWSQYWCVNTTPYNITHNISLPSWQHVNEMFTSRCCSWFAWDPKSRIIIGRFFWTIYSNKRGWYVKCHYSSDLFGEVVCQLSKSGNSQLQMARTTTLSGILATCTILHVVCLLCADGSSSMISIFEGNKHQSTSYFRVHTAPGFWCFFHGQKRTAFWTIMAPVSTKTGFFA